MRPKHLILSVTILTTAAHAQHTVVLTPDTAGIAVAFGSLDEIIGRDQTMQNPVLQSKPNIDIHRRLTVEPIIAAKPDIAIGSRVTQSADIFIRLRTTDVNAANVVPDDSIVAYPQNIRHVGQLIGGSTQADEIASGRQANMKQQPASGGRYLFSYDGRIVSGKDTAADEIICRAGGINAVAAIDGLGSMTYGAWTAAEPDIIVIADHNTVMIGNTKAFTAHLKIAGSPAVGNGKTYLQKASGMFRYGLDTPQVVQRLNGLTKQTAVFRRPMFQPEYLIPRHHHSRADGILS